MTKKIDAVLSYQHYQCLAAYLADKRKRRFALQQAQFLGYEVRTWKDFWNLWRVTLEHFREEYRSSLTS
jgi:hypothetical protein